MKKKELIYGLLAITVMSCQAIPTNNTPSVQDNKKLVDKGQNFLSDEQMNFGVLSWSDYRDCYGVYSNAPRTWDVIVVSHLDDGTCPDGFNDGHYWSTPNGPADCVMPINVVCENYGNQGGDNNTNNCDNRNNKTFSTQALTPEQKSNFKIQNDLFGIYNYLELNKRDSYFLAEVYTESVKKTPELFGNTIIPIHKYIKKVEPLKEKVISIKNQPNISSESAFFADRLLILIDDVIRKYHNYSSYNTISEIEAEYRTTDNLYSSLYSDLKSSIISLSKQRTKEEKLRTLLSNTESFSVITSRLMNNDENNPGFLIEQSLNNFLFNLYLSDLNRSHGNNNYNNESIVNILNKLLIKSQSINLKISAQKAQLTKVKLNLEIAGLIDSNNNVIETDTDVKPLAEKLINNIKNIEFKTSSLSDSSYWGETNSQTSDDLKNKYDNQVQDLKNTYTQTDNEISNLKNTIQLEIDEEKEEDLECAELKLKVDKKEFSPNNDNIDDSVTFSIIAPKNKSWTLELSLKKEDNQTELIKTFSGTGTGEPQNYDWSGDTDTSTNIANGKVIASLKEGSNTVNKNITCKVCEYNYQDIQNDSNQMTDLANSVLDKIEPLEAPQDSSFSVQAVNTDITFINNELARIKQLSRELRGISEIVAKKAAVKEIKTATRKLITSVARNTTIGASGLAVGLYLSVALDIYDAIDIGTGICESLYKQYNIATSLLAIQRLIDVTVPIIEGIKADKCLMNTSILDLNNVVGKQLGSSMNVVIEGFQNYITAIKDKKKDEGNTNIDNAKNVLDARINGYETNTVPNAKTQMDNKCQNDNNESNCIRTARKEFNLNGERKAIRIKANDLSCLVYRSGNPTSPLTFTPRDPDDATYVGLKIGASCFSTSARLSGKLTTVKVLNLLPPLYAFFDDKNGHISVRTDGPKNSVENDMKEWARNQKLLKEYGDIVLLKKGWNGINWFDNGIFYKNEELIQPLTILFYNSAK